MKCYWKCDNAVESQKTIFKDEEFDFNEMKHSYIFNTMLSHQTSYH